MRLAAAPLLRSLLLLLLCSAPLVAEPLRLATFNTELSRKGPGLLLRDLRRADDQIEAVLKTIVAARADVLVLQGIDWDMQEQTLAALQKRLAAEGAAYPYRFTARPNAGLASGRDLDGDGRLNEAEDAWGWGRFTGQGGMAVLSRLPIDHTKHRDLTSLRWQDLPFHRMPQNPDGTPYPNQNIAAELRVSSVNHWLLPLRLPDGRELTLMTFHASPPVFDGPEDRNGRRNADELLLWLHLLDGHLGTPPTAPFVIAGDANNDPDRGEGHKDPLRRLLDDPRLQETMPTDVEGASHTVVWARTGPMRVDYILPSAGLRVTGKGVLRSEGSRHGLVWIEIEP